MKRLPFFIPQMPSKDELVELFRLGIFKSKRTTATATDNEPKESTNESQK